MSTEIAVHELVGITAACHTCIAGLVCGSLDFTGKRAVSELSKKVKEIRLKRCGYVMRRGEEYVGK